MDSIFDYEFILFGAEHYNPLGVVRSLGEAGIYPNVIVQRSKIHTTSASKYVKNKHIVDSVEEGYKVLLSQYGKKEKKSFIIATDDTVSSYLDLKYDEMKDLFYFFNAGQKGRVTSFMNKQYLNETAKCHGFNVLSSWQIKNHEIPNDLEYPVITKAIDSTKPGWKNVVHICNSREELADVLETIGNQDILVQKYLQKKNELCIDGFSVNKGCEVALTMGSSYNYMLADSYSSNMTLFNIDNEELQARISSLFATIGYEGIFTIEFLIDQNDELWFMEINFRNSAWSWASTKLGMNMPILWADGMVKKHLPDGWLREIPKGYRAIVELSDFRSRVKTHQVGLNAWIREVRNADCLFLWDKQDIRPVINELVGIVRRKIVKSNC